MSSDCAPNERASSLEREKQAEWRVRPMKIDDVERCLSIWSQVELTEARQTVASSLKCDPDGFYVAELLSTGQVIGMCAGTLARDDTAFMGFYAVDPEYQGIGVGRELWATTISRLDKSTNIGLYGVPAMSEKYKKSGFKLEDTNRMLIFESQPGQEVRLDLLNHFDDLKSRNEDETLELQLINSETSANIFDKLLEYDALVNKFSREKLLRNYLFDQPDVPLTLALVRKKIHAPSASSEGESKERGSACCLGSSGVDIETELSGQMRGSLSFNNQVESIEVLGYGCIREDNTNGGIVGPIYAESSSICEVILRSLLERFELSPTGKYSVMSLTSNSQAADILERIGLTEMDQCSRMFTKFLPEASTGKIFYVHSPNFTLF